MLIGLWSMLTNIWIIIISQGRWVLNGNYRVLLLIDMQLILWYKLYEKDLTKIAVEKRLLQLFYCMLGAKKFVKNRMLIWVTVFLKMKSLSFWGNKWKKSSIYVGKKVSIVDRQTYSKWVKLNVFFLPC